MEARFSLHPSYLHSSFLGTMHFLTLLAAIFTVCLHAPYNMCTMLCLALSVSDITY